jgi:hypothetical protein
MDGEKNDQNHDSGVPAEFIWQLLKLWKPLRLSSSLAEPIKSLNIRHYIRLEPLWYHCGC